MMIAHDIDYRATGNAPVAIKNGRKTDGLRNRLATRSSCIGSTYLVRR